MSIESLIRVFEVVFGLQYLFFGLNGFFNWVKPPPIPERGQKLLEAFIQSGYLMPLIKGIEILAGILLVVGYFKVLALLILAPISLNIFLFHFFVGNRKDVLAWLILLTQVFLTWTLQGPGCQLLP